MLKILQSSANSNKLSLTVKGILVGLIPLALLIFGGNIEAGDLQGAIDSIIAAITAIFGAFAAVITAWGAIRKVLVKTRKKV